MIELRAMREVLKYDAETGVFTWLERRGSVPAGARAGTLTKNGYRVIFYKGNPWMEHRLAWLYQHGNFPADGLQIDHINREKADNRIANLRVATRAQQQINTATKADHRFGSKGVRFRNDRARWRAEIYVDRKPVFLGNFETFDAAASAYSSAAKKYYGDFHSA